MSIRQGSKIIASMGSMNSSIDLSDYALKTDIPTNVSAFTNDAGYLTEHQDISGKADKSDTYTKTEVDTKLENVSVDLTDYALKSELPIVPTNVSAFTNDSGFITNEIVSEVATSSNKLVAKSELPTLVDLAQAGKGIELERKLLEETFNYQIQGTPDIDEFGVMTFNGTTNFVYTPNFDIFDGVVFELEFTTPSLFDSQGTIVQCFTDTYSLIYQISMNQRQQLMLMCTDNTEYISTSLSTDTLYWIRAKLVGNDIICTLLSSDGTILEEKTISNTVSDIKSLLFRIGRSNLPTKINLNKVTFGDWRAYIPAFDGYEINSTIEMPDISGKADKSDTYTKTEVDTKLENVSVDESNLVHKSDDEEIAGVKTFVGDTTQMVQMNLPGIIAQKDTLGMGGIMNVQMLPTESGMSITSLQNSEDLNSTPTIQLTDNKEFWNGGTRMSYGSESRFGEDVNTVTNIAKIELSNNRVDYENVGISGFRVITSNTDTSNTNDLIVATYEDGSAKAFLQGTNILNIPTDSNDGTLVTTQYLKTKTDGLTTTINTKADKSDTYTKSEVDAKVSSVYRFKGSVANYDALPTTGLVVGDVYNIESNGSNYAWDGNDWDKLSETINLTPYLTKTEASTTYATINDVNGEIATLEGSISAKADKAEIPTKTSQLTNDSGYLTSHQDISGKANTSLNNLTTAGNEYIDSRIIDIMNNQLSIQMDKIYPVGSLYFGEQETCPMATLISGSVWELIDGDRVLQSSSSTHTAGSTIEAGLPNITGSITLRDMSQTESDSDGAFTLDTTAGNGDYTGTNQYVRQYFKANFSASSSSAIYGASNTVQPPAYVVNIWKRTK